MTTSAFVRSFLLNTRYWWLEGVDTGTVRKGIADVFHLYDIENIAPDTGPFSWGVNWSNASSRCSTTFFGISIAPSSIPRYIPRDMER